MLKVCLLSDTHGHIDNRILLRAQGCDCIVHAGDIGGAGVLRQLEQTRRSVVAVVGNNDVPAKWPDEERGELASLLGSAVLDLPGGRLAIEHGHPFTFLRGAAAVMASDLAAGTRTDLRVEFCGDAHLGNFRWYFAPSRELVFDLNDFDETLPGPFEWDVKRLAASITVAARANGFSAKKARAATRTAMRQYRKHSANASELGPLDLYYYRLESEAALARIEKYGKGHRKWKQEVLEKAARRNSLRAFDKLTKVVDGQRRIIPDPPLIVCVDDKVAAAETGAAAEFLARYRETLPLDRRIVLDRFSLVDVAKKVVGVGSVGTRCLIVLLEAGDGTPLFLQFKQATSSVLEAHLGATAFKQAGQRVVEGQRLI